MELISPAFFFLSDDAVSVPSLVDRGKDKQATSKQQAGTFRDHFIPLKTGFEIGNNYFLLIDRLQKEPSSLP